MYVKPVVSASSCSDQNFFSVLAFSVFMIPFCSFIACVRMATSSLLRETLRKETILKTITVHI